ncbi:hypothetical protein [Jeotgalibacillus aurantiacus]|uniref:hypothetical protein n=1 Tax=Jeotgalibacillus aurantiacus TaxID=2763266 RepID=UPI001D0B89B6|nr:hypothetical protein [Jeotgalibacillus aurantiacus]
MKTIVLSKWSDVVVPAEKVYNTTLTRDQKIIIVDEDFTPFVNLDERTFSQDFTVRIIDRNAVSTFAVKDLPFIPNKIDTYTDGTILLASCRCRRTEDWIQQNARRYTMDGECLDEFVLGDGISDLAIDDENTIWVGYFDEGVYGNLGWEEPIGYSGIAVFSEKGEVVFRPELPMMFELQGFNVQSADQVFAHYTLMSSFVYFDHFEEVQHDEIEEKISFSQFILIDADTMLVYCSQRLNFLILKRSNGEFRLENTVMLKDEHGKELEHKNASIRMRGNHLFLMNSKGIYHAEVSLDSVIEVEE